MYGSLKRGFSHHDQMKGGIYAGDAELTEHRLVLYEESYPALCAVPGNRGTVQGELYLVSQEHLLRLDVFEDVPTLYQRSLISLIDGRKAWAYIIDNDRAGGYPPLVGRWSGTSRGE